MLPTENQRDKRNREPQSPVHLESTPNSCRWPTGHSPGKPSPLPVLGASAASVPLPRTFLLHGSLPPSCITQGHLFREASRGCFQELSITITPGPAVHRPHHENGPPTASSGSTRLWYPHHQTQRPVLTATITHCTLTPCSQRDALNRGMTNPCSPSCVCVCVCV